MHGLEPLRLVQGALQLDLALLVVSALRQLDGHQPRLSLALLRLDHEMRHALLERVDDDVRQLAVHPVGAADAIADLEAHVSLPFTPTGRAESTGSNRRITIWHQSGIPARELAENGTRPPVHEQGCSS